MCCQMNTSLLRDTMIEIVDDAIELFIVSVFNLCHM